MEMTSRGVTNINQ